jgi:uncharacterized protein YjbI with pentapeptide repeats
MPKRFALAALGLLLVTATWAQEAQKPEACLHPKGWKPTTNENLLAWLHENKDDLCNVDLSNAELSGADLTFAHLHGADLSRADLSGANLFGADLNNANLSQANLNKADLASADLNKANLSQANLNNATLYIAKLNNANLFGANLNKALLQGADLNNANLFQANLNSANLSAKLNNANLFQANLNNAYLFGAELIGANLLGAKLHKADLSVAKLNNANLIGAELIGANLRGTSIAGATLADANLTAASYAPTSAPPDSYVASIHGLTTVTFPAGEEIGLVQLRDLLQKAGLRDLEREATFAIEHGNTKHSLDDWRQNPAGAAEGIFRYVAFDMTTRYGLRPSRALLLIAALWLLLIPIYAWPIWPIKRPPKRAAIYRIWPKDRVDIQEDQPTQDNPTRERLHRHGLAAIGWSAYFSLLSAFQVGYREFSVGSWLSRAQPRDFALQATGWVRTVSGIQSLLSVYLLAIWLLTYFGRPFQ